MDTSNTITPTSWTQLTRALSVLETLCNEDNIPILEFLRKKEKASLAELYFQTGESPEKLEMRLESLCDTGCVMPEVMAMGWTYRLNQERISQINRVGRRIGQIREDAVHE